MSDYIPYNKWKRLRDDAIKTEYSERPTGELAEEMGLNYYTLSRRAARLGVSKSAGFMHTSFKKGSRPRPSCCEQHSEAGHCLVGESW